MSISLTLRENKRTLGAKINGALASVLNRIFRRKSSAIAREIKSRIPEWVKSQPEMMDLATNTRVGSLVGQFGLPQGTGRQAVDAIAQAVADSMEIRLSSINKRSLQGGLTISIMPQTFSSLLSLPEGHVFDKDLDLHWLEWLLKKGFKVIVVGYSYKFIRSGRSGAGLMKNGGFWRVPPQFAGTEDDNFVTRALTGPEREKEIRSIIERNIK